MKNLILSTVLLVLCLSGPTPSAAAVTIENRDADGLVAAIHEANLRGRGTIVLAKGGIYTLSTTADDQRRTGLPTIRGRVRIRGQGAEIRRYSDENFGLFAIAPRARLELQDVTLSEGSDGAIVNAGELKLIRVQVIDNTAGEQAAIIENLGQAEIVDSAISFNQIGSSGRDTGIIRNYGRLRLVSSRIESNFVSPRYGSLLAASAVLNLGDLQLRGVAIRANTAARGAGPASIGVIVNQGRGTSELERVTSELNEPSNSPLVAAAETHWN